MKGETMAQNTINIPESESSSAAAKHQKTYSAKELADLYLTDRPTFLVTDLVEATSNWNPNYIYDFLYHIRDIKKIDLAIEWLHGVWIDKHDVYVSFDITKNTEINKMRQEFEANLIYIREKIVERLKHEDKMSMFRETFGNGYTCNSTTTSQTVTHATGTTSTPPPAFKAPIANNNEIEGQTPSIKLGDLPLGIRKKIVVSQKVFDVFVKQLNEDLWLTVEKEKTKLCGCLFFLSNYHNITSRDTKAEEFNDLLHCVVTALNGEKSLLSSIRRRKETKESSIKRSYQCFSCADINPKMRKEIWQLINDCKLLADGFQPILEAIEAEKVATQNPSIQASSAV